MKVVCLKVGLLNTNCYIVINNQQCIIIDPGGDAEQIIEYITNHQLKLIGYLITHQHPDHIMALDELIKQYQIKPYVSDTLFHFEVILTPGHTMDSVCYYFSSQKIMFTGDTLFKDIIGRFDFNESNREAMFNSLDRLKTYPDNTVIYPGHGETSTLGYEKKCNKWLQ